MKKLILILSYLVITIFVNAQVPELKWAKQIGGISNDDGRSIIVDALGNVYTTGSFEGTVDFNPGSGTFNLTSSPNDQPNIFIVKLDASGNFLWAKNMGGTNISRGISLKLDVSGNIYTTGWFIGTMDFNPNAGIFNLTAISLDIFISKFDALGNFVWAKSMGGNGQGYGISINIDGLGNVYTTGFFFGTIDFDPGPVTFNFTSATGKHDIFILKLDASGTFVWAKKIGGILDDEALSSAIDGSSNIYTTGYFQGTVDFDPGSGTFNLTSAGIDDIFILKLDALGNFVWTKNIGGVLHDRGQSITIDALGNIYTTGYFEGAADFDPGAGTFILTSAGQYDIFISKLNSSGDFVWAKKIGGVTYDDGLAITVDVFGNVYTTGRFGGTIDFDPNAGVFNITASSLDIFILKLDATGNFVWATNMGGTGNDYGMAISVDVSGNVYTTGYFLGKADFDPGTGIFNLSSLGYEDVFILKLSQTGVGINDYSNNNNVNIYPNPTDGAFNVVVHDPSNNSRIEIYNSLGTLVYKQTKVYGLNAIKLSNQANGLYFVKVIDEQNRIQTGKVVMTD